jgi:excisionase family DNA binding protein
MNDILTVAEAAIYLRVSKAQLYRMIIKKQIPHTRLGEKRVVIRRDQLEAWLKAQSVIPKQ